MSSCTMLHVLRFASALSLAGLSACRASDVERPRDARNDAEAGVPSPEDETRVLDEPNTDTHSEPEPRSGGDHAACVATCIERHQMQATAPEVIEANCRRSCSDED